MNQETTYTSPLVEVITLAVEQGYQSSLGGRNNAEDIGGGGGGGDINWD